jgi:DNA-binding NtrC family response regulator
VMQDGEFTRVGGNEVIKTDVRVIAASNVDLKRAVELGSFRQDLFYRLSVFPIKLPPLRERPEDIHPLVIHFIEHYKQKTGRFISGISKDALQALITYEWAGNVRELENAIERAVALGSGPIVHVGDLPSNLQYPTTERLPERNELLPLEELERRAILRTLRETAGDKLAAARILGIGKTTLYRKLKQYNLETEASTQNA